MRILRVLCFVSIVIFSPWLADCGENAGVLSSQERSALSKQRDQLRKEMRERKKAGDLKGAYTSGKKALLLIRELEQKKSRYLLYMLNELTEITQARRDFPATKELLTEVVVLTGSVHGPDDWRVTDARLALEHSQKLSRLSKTELGKLDKARELDRERGEFFKQKNYLKVIEKLEKILAIHKQVLGEDHREYAIFLNQLGVACAREGMHTRVEALYQQALKIQMRVLGSQHPDVAQQRTNLGYHYDRKSDYEQSVDNYRKATMISRAVHGKKHKKYLETIGSLVTSLRSLAFKYTKQEKFEAARKLRKEIESMQLERFGSDHWQVREAECESRYLDCLSALGPKKRAQLTKSYKVDREARALYRQKQYEQTVVKMQQSLKLTASAVGKRNRLYSGRLCHLATYLRKLSRYDQAAAAREEAVGIYRQILGKTHPYTAYTLNALGFDLEKCGRLYDASLRFKEASMSHWKFYRERKAEFKSAQLNQDRVLRKHAKAMLRVWNLKAASRAHRELVDLAMSIHKADGWHVTDARLELEYSEKLSRLKKAELEELKKARELDRERREFFQQKKYRNVIVSIEKILAIHKKVLGENHREYATLLNQLGVAYGRQRMYARADYLHQRGLQIQLKVLGEQHPDVAQQMENLGYLYRQMADYSRSVEKYRKASMIRLAVHGSKHKDYLSSLGYLVTSMRSLASEYTRQEKFTAAGKLCKEIESTQLKRFGSGHWQVHEAKRESRHLDRLISLKPEGRTLLVEAEKARRQAHEFYRKKQLEQAVIEQQRSLKLTESAMGKKNRLYGERLYRLAMFLGHLSRYGQAVEAREGAVQIYRQIHGDAHPALADTLNALGIDLEKAGDLRRASLQFEEACKVYEKCAGTWHERIKSVRLNLVRVFRKQAKAMSATGDLEAACKFREQELAVNIRMWGKEHWLVYEARDALEHLKRKMKLKQPQLAELKKADRLRKEMVTRESELAYTQVVPLARSVLEIRERLLGPDDSQVALCYMDLGNACDLAGEQNKALKHFSRALEIYRRVFSSKHPETARCLSDIGNLQGILRDWQASEAALRETCDIFKAAWGKGHYEFRKAEGDFENLAVARSGTERRYFLTRKRFEIAEKSSNLIKTIKTPEMKGKVDEICEKLSDALVINRIVYGRYSVAAINILDFQAKQEMLRQGFRAAREALTEAIHCRVKLYGEKSWQVTEARCVLSEVDVIAALTAENYSRLTSADQQVDSARRLRNERKWQQALSQTQNSLKIYRELFAENIRRTADCLNLAGMIHSDLQQIDKARECYDEVLSIRRKLLGNEHPRVIDSLSVFGILLDNAGEKRAAGSLLLEANTLARKVYGPRSEKYADCLNNYGNLLGDIGESKQAQICFDQALAIRREALGPDHADVAYSLNSLGIFVQNRGDLKGALPYLEQAVKIWQKKLGADNNSTIIARANLGRLYRDLGRFEEALETLTRAAVSGERVWAENHPSLIRIHGDLGCLHWRLGDLKQAIVFIRRAAAMAGRGRGKLSAQFHDLLNKLVNIYDAVGNTRLKARDFAGLRQTRKEALDAMQQLCGPEHWRVTDLRLALKDVDVLSGLDKEVIKSMPDSSEFLNRIRAFREQGAIAKTQEILEQDHRQLQKIWGDRHRETISCLLFLAVVHSSNREFDKALLLYKKALPELRQVLGERHPDVVETMLLLAGLHKERGALGQAGQTLRESLVIADTLYDKRHWKRMQIISMLANVSAAVAEQHEKEGRYAKAAGLLQEILVSRTEALGENHWQVAGTRAALHRAGCLAALDANGLAEWKHEQALSTECSALFEAEKYRDVLRVAEKRLKINEKIFGPESLPVSGILLVLAYQSRMIKEYGQSRAYYDRALNISRKTVGEMHPETASIYSKLSRLLQDMDELVAGRQLLQKAVSISETVEPGGFNESFYLNDLALAWEREKDYARAKNCYERALKIRKSLLGLRHERTGWVLRNFASLYRDMGLLPEARKHIEEAVETFKQSCGLEHVQTAKTLHELGFVCMQQEEYELAQGYLQQSLDIMRKLFKTDDKAAIAMTVKVLGELAADRGRFKQAEVHLMHALGILKRVHGEGHLDIARCLNSIGRLHRLSGRRKPARNYFEQCLAMVRKLRGPEHPKVAEAMRSLAQFPENAGDYPAALKIYREALAIEEHAWQKNDLRLGQAFSDFAYRLRVMGYYQEAIVYAERALEIYRKEAGLEHQQTSELMRKLGMLYYYGGDYSTSRQYLEQALAIDRKVWGKEHQRVATALNALALVVDAMGDDRAAASLREEALRIVCKIWGVNHPKVAVYLNNLGYTLSEIDPERSKECFARKLAIYQKKLAAEDPPSASSLLEVGEQLEDLKRYPEALQHIEKALATEREQYGKESPRIIGSLYGVARVMFAMDRFVDSRPYYEEILLLARKAYGEKHEDYAFYAERLGRALFRLDKKEEALRLFKQALETYRKLRGNEHPYVAEKYNSLGIFFLNQGELKKACEHFEQALAIRKKVMGAEHRETAETRLELAHSLAAMREFSNAWTQTTLGARAISRLTRQSLASNAESALFAIVGQSRYVFEMFLNLAEVAPKVTRERGNDLLAMVFDWKAASGQMLMTRREAMVLEQDPTAVKHHQELQSVRQQLVRARMRSLGRSGNTTEERQMQKLRVREAELGRELARRVSDYSQLRQIIEASPDVLWPYLEVDSMLVELVKYRSFDFQQRDGDKIWGAERYGAILLRGPPRSGWLTDIKQAEKESKRHNKPMLLYFHAAWAAHSLMMEKTVLNPTEILRLINVEFVAVKIDIEKHKDLARRLKVTGIPTILAVGTDGSIIGKSVGYRDRVAFFQELIKMSKKKQTRATVRFVPLGAAEPIDKAVRCWREAAQRGEIEQKSEEELLTRVWHPIAEALPEAIKRLYIAPDGELSLLPFEALRLKDNRYVVEKYRVSYVSSGRDLMPRLRSPAKPGPAVVLMSPDYDSMTMLSPGRRAGEATSQKRSKEIVKRDLNFRVLPGFAREAEAVVAAWKRARPRDPIHILTGREANEEALAQLKRPRMLHLVTHGFYLPSLRKFLPQAPAGAEVAVTDQGALMITRDVDSLSSSAGSRSMAVRSGEDFRLRSGLALAGANRWQSRTRQKMSDGLLNALEVQNLNLWGTELVVLSACKTGLGEVRTGEGVLGLRRAFQHAGAETVVASLWKIPDAETQVLITAFMDNWLSGMPKAAALRKAQLELIKKLRLETNPARSNAPPYYWAGFICHGK